MNRKKVNGIKTTVSLKCLKRRSKEDWTLKYEIVTGTTSNKATDGVQSFFFSCLDAGWI